MITEYLLTRFHLYEIRFRFLFRYLCTLRTKNKTKIFVYLSVLLAGVSKGFVCVLCSCFCFCQLLVDRHCRNVICSDFSLLRCWFGRSTHFDLFHLCHFHFYYFLSLSCVTTMSSYILFCVQYSLCIIICLLAFFLGYLLHFKCILIEHYVVGCFVISFDYISN